MNAGPFRDGRVHVLREKCATCVFRPGNLMRLEPGRLQGMVREAVADDSAITCHSTLYREDVDQAVCRGFADGYATLPLRLAAALDVLEEVPPPPPRT